jgi:hypothetical protein
MNTDDPTHTGPDPLSDRNETTYKELDFSDKGHQLLSCPQCGHIIHGADINIEKLVAKCSQCNYVFGFSHNSASGKLEPELVIPEGIEVLKLRSELELRLDWKKTTSVGGRKFLTVFTILWNLILLPFVLGIIFSGAWGILLFMSLHLAVGLGLMWYLASIYLNKTIVTITPRFIRTRTWPLRNFFSRPKEIETATVQQLYVSKYTESRTNGVPNYAYALYALLDNGERLVLIKGMNQETQRYIEQEVESYLKIRDWPVQEEAS